MKPYRRLTEAQRLEILRRWITESTPVRVLAAEYDVGTATIERIVYGNKRNTSRVCYKEPSKEETRGGNQRFQDNMKEYCYYDSDDFWKRRQVFDHRQ